MSAQKQKPVSPRHNIHRSAQSGGLRTQFAVNFPWRAPIPLLIKEDASSCVDECGSHLALRTTKFAFHQFIRNEFGHLHVRRERRRRFNLAPCLARVVSEPLRLRCCSCARRTSIFKPTLLSAD